MEDDMTPPGCFCPRAEAVEAAGRMRAQAIDAAYWRMITAAQFLSKGWGLAVRSGWLAGTYKVECFAVPPGGAVPAGCTEVIRGRAR